MRVKNKSYGTITTYGCVPRKPGGTVMSKMLKFMLSKSSIIASDVKTCWLMLDDVNRNTNCTEEPNKSIYVKCLRK